MTSPPGTPMMMLMMPRSSVFHNPRMSAGKADIRTSVLKKVSTSDIGIPSKLQSECADAGRVSVDISIQRQIAPRSCHPEDLLRIDQIRPVQMLGTGLSMTEEWHYPICQQ